jgi:hypothetical protein
MLENIFTGGHFLFTLKYTDSLGSKEIRKDMMVSRLSTKKKSRSVNQKQLFLHGSLQQKVIF